MTAHHLTASPNPLADSLADAIHIALAHERHHHQMVSILLAGAKADLFAGQNRRWLDWAKAASGLKEDTIYQRARAGAFLVRVLTAATTPAQLASLRHLLAPAVSASQSAPELLTPGEAAPITPLNPILPIAGEPAQPFVAPLERSGVTVSASQSAIQPLTDAGTPNLLCPATVAAWLALDHGPYQALKSLPYGALIAVAPLDDPSLRRLLEQYPQLPEMSRAEISAACDALAGRTPRPPAPTEDTPAPVADPDAPLQLQLPGLDELTAMAPLPAAQELAYACVWLGRLEPVADQLPVRQRDKFITQLEDFLTTLKQSAAR